MGTMTYSLWYKGKSYDSGSYRVLACNAIDDTSQMPNDPAGTRYLWPKNGLDGWGATGTNTVSFSDGNLVVDSTGADPIIARTAVFNTSIYTHLIFRAKIESGTQNGEGGYLYNGFNYYVFTVPVYTDNDWHIYDIYLPDVYSGEVAFFRLDMLGSSGRYLISDIYIGTGEYIDNSLIPIPNNPSGVVYRNDTAWTGWSDAGSPSSLVISDGVIKVTGNGFLRHLSLPLPPSSSEVYIKARVSASALPCELLVDARDSLSQYVSPALGPLSTDWRFFRASIGVAKVVNVYRSTYPTLSGDLELGGLYYGDGSYLPNPCKSIATKAHLCIHPTTKQLGFFQNSIFTPFSTEAIIEDDKKYHICLMMNNGLATLRLNGKLMVTDLPMFSEDTYPITKWGNYYPSEMSFKRGLAPSTTLKPSSTLAPSNTVLSNTTHANGWIDEIRIYNRILSADDVEGIIYHTLLQE